MRLQLISVALAWAQLAHAEPDRERRAAGSLHLYADDDGMTVVSPAATAQAPVAPTVLVDTAVAVDVVTGASVDVITSASPGTIHERRVEGTLGVAVDPTRTTTLGARAIASHEHDYDAVHLTLSGRLELAKRNTILELAADGGWEQASSVVDPSFEAERRTQRAIATLSQVLGVRTYVDLIVDVSRARGYHASPYRTVPIIDPASPALVRVPEVTPALRRAGAAALRVRHAIGEHSAVHATYRAYADDWAVHSHTLGVAALTEAADRRWRAGAALRGYAQTAADFARTRYLLTDGMVPALRTRDRALAAMQSLGATLTADVALTAADDDGPRLLVELGAIRYRFDTAAQHERSALITSVGVTAPF